MKTLARMDAFLAVLIGCCVAGTVGPRAGVGVGVLALLAFFIDRKRATSER